MSTYVPFDRDWWAIGYLEPEFNTEVYGWANEQILIDSGMLAVRNGCGDAVTWVPEVSFQREPLPEPVPLKRTVLRWVWVADDVGVR